MAFVANGLCTSCATITDVPTPYDGCEDVTKKYGANHLILVKCDYQFTDITDDTEWDAAITSGDISCTPEGKVTIPEPSFTSIPITGCGREITGDVEYIIDFETYQTDPDLLDTTYWADVFDNMKNYVIVLKDCNGIYRMQKDWVDAIVGLTNTVAGTSPGFEASITKVPVEVEGDEGLSKWVTQFKIKTTGVLRSTYLPAVSIC